MTGTSATYYVDEAGDGVLFGRKGRNRLNDPDASRFFILGMVRCSDDSGVAERLDELRQEVLADPLYSGIRSIDPKAGKTARFFHAKDDHQEIRARVFQVLTKLDFQLFVVIKDMRHVLAYVKSRNEMDSRYRYQPNELYDLTTRMLFKHRLHKEPAYRITFARRGNADRTRVLREQLEVTRQRFLNEHKTERSEVTLEIVPAYPWEAPCLQVADYALWAVQRCFEKHEARFLRALWPKVSLIHDVDDPDGKHYGTYLTRKSECPDPEKIKNRWI